MQLKALMVTITGLLITTTSIFAQDRLEAYAKFQPTMAYFTGMESTNMNKDGWEFDETMEFGYEIGTVLEIGHGMRAELGFLHIPGVHFDGAQVQGGSSTESQGSDADLYLDAFAVMADFKWDFTTLFMSEGPFQAFVGLGLGFSYISVDKMESGLGTYRQTIEGETGWNPAYRFTLGANYRFNKEFVLTCSYSFMNLGEAEVGNEWTDNNGLSSSNFRRELDLDLEAHVLQVGLYYVF